MPATSAPADIERLLTAGQAARAAGVSVDTIRRAADAGRLPGVLTPGGHRRFRREDLAALLRPARRAGGARP